MEIFTVIAHRWGDDHNHSYFVGNYSTKELAYEMARAEEQWRAGKYECKIISSLLDDIDAEVRDYYRSNLDYAEVWPDDDRIDMIGRNGNDGLHYDTGEK